LASALRLLTAPVPTITPAAAITITVRRHAIGAITPTLPMPARPTGITDPATLWAACLSAPAPGITGAGVDAMAMVAAMDMAGAVMPMADAADMDTATGADMADALLMPGA